MKMMVALSAALQLIVVGMHMGHYDHDLPKSTHLKTNLRLGDGQFRNSFWKRVAFEDWVTLARSIGAMKRTMTTHDRRRIKLRFELRQAQRKIKKAISVIQWSFSVIK